MPKFTSDLTSKSFSTTALPQYDVPDASEGPDFDALDIARQQRGLPPLDEKTKRAMLASMQQQETSAPHAEVSSVKQLQEFEHKIETARKLKQNDRLSSSAKARIEALCDMSRGTREVNIDETMYVLQTLKSKEHRAAIVAAAEFDGSAHAAFEVRKQLLARSLSKIGGYDVELFLGDGSAEARLEFVDELDEAVLIKLYSEYLDLAQNTQNKYFIKTESELKEVMEDLKK